MLFSSVTLSVLMATLPICHSLNPRVQHDRSVRRQAGYGSLAVNLTDSEVVPRPSCINYTETWATGSESAHRSGGTGRPWLPTCEQSSSTASLNASLSSGSTSVDATATSSIITSSESLSVDASSRSVPVTTTGSSTANTTFPLQPLTLTMTESATFTIMSTHYDTGNSTAVNSSIVDGVNLPASSTNTTASNGTTTTNIRPTVTVTATTDSTIWSCHSGINWNSRSGCATATAGGSCGNGETPRWTNTTGNGCHSTTASDTTSTSFLGTMSSGSTIVSAGGSSARNTSSTGSPTTTFIPLSRNRTFASTVSGNTNFTTASIAPWLNATASRSTNSTSITGVWTTLSIESTLIVFSAVTTVVIPMEGTSLVQPTSNATASTANSTVASTGFPTAYNNTRSRRQWGTSTAPPQAPRPWTTGWNGTNTISATGSSSQPLFPNSTMVDNVSTGISGSGTETRFGTGTGTGTGGQPPTPTTSSTNGTIINDVLTSTSNSSTSISLSTSNSTITHGTFPTSVPCNESVTVHFPNGTGTYTSNGTVTLTASAGTKTSTRTLTIANSTATSITSNFTPPFFNPTSSNTRSLPSTITTSGIGSTTPSGRSSNSTVSRANAPITQIFTLSTTTICQIVGGNQDAGIGVGIRTCNPTLLPNSTTSTSETPGLFIPTLLPGAESGSTASLSEITANASTRATATDSGSTSNIMATTQRGQGETGVTVDAALSSISTLPSIPADPKLQTITRTLSGSTVIPDTTTTTLWPTDRSWSWSFSDWPGSETAWLGEKGTITPTTGPSTSTGTGGTGEDIQDDGDAEMGEKKNLRGVPAVLVDSHKKGQGQGATPTTFVTFTSTK